jgi:hypothetical protein
MTGDLYIDDIDVYSEYGIFVTDSGYKSLVQWAELKEVECNDWAEYDGIEVDLSDPVLDAREITVDFACTQKTNIESLFEILVDGSTHEFNFAKISKIYNLRLTSQSNKEAVESLEVFTLKFVEDLPFDDYDEYVEPVDLSVGTQGYEIDGVDLSEYGLRVLSGTYESVFAAGDVKENLIIKTTLTAGQEYDSEVLFFKEKDVALKLLLHCDLDSFWTNYEALLYNLIQPDERILTTKYNDQEHPCYYKKSTVSEFALINDNDVWCEFTVTLCVTSSRPVPVYYLLASDSGEVATTDDGVYFIDMEIYLN